MEFDEIATSDCITPIRFYLFNYKGKLEGELQTLDEFESFLWYDTFYGQEILSNILKHQVILYCVKNKLNK